MTTERITARQWDATLEVWLDESRCQDGCHTWDLLNPPNEICRCGGCSDPGNDHARTDER